MITRQHLPGVYIFLHAYRAKLWFEYICKLWYNVYNVSVLNVYYVHRCGYSQARMMWIDSVLYNAPIGMLAELVQPLLNFMFNDVWFNIYRDPYFHVTNPSCPFYSFDIFLSKCSLRHGIPSVGWILVPTSKYPHKCLASVLGMNPTPPILPRIQRRPPKI